MELDPRFTLLSGPNASGKTSLLEASMCSVAADRFARDGSIS